MPVNLEDLNPRNALMNFEGKVYEFGAFTLRARVWAHYEFQTDDEKDGLKVLAARLKNFDVIAAGEVLYYLLIDKVDFPTKADFVKKFANQSKGHERLYKCLSTVFGLSEPQIEELGKAELAKKAIAAK